MINDLYHFWGSDLDTTVTGDVQTADGTERGQQRVLRRLLTNPGDYVFQPEYGAGLPQWIGQPIDEAKVGALILSHILLEDAVAATPAPVISVAAAPNDPSAIAVSIAYTDAPTNRAVSLSFTVSA